MKPDNKNVPYIPIKKTRWDDGKRIYVLASKSQIKAGLPKELFDDLVKRKIVKGITVKSEVKNVKSTKE